MNMNLVNQTTRT